MEHIYHHNMGYEQVRKPGHHRAAKHTKLVYRHILVYEEHYKCCVLASGHIHHINGVKDDNRIENLQLLGAGVHSKITNTMDLPDRKCSSCRKDTCHYYKNGRPEWHWYNSRLLCPKCYRKAVYSYVKVRVGGRNRNRKDISNRTCIKCSSNTTWVSTKGYSFWFKGENKGEYICSRCAKSRYR